METPYFIIVKSDKAYINEQQIDVDFSIITNSTIESVENINRVAVVEVAPEWANVERGDLVVCHHNIFRKYYDYTGKLRNSNFYIKDNLYMVPPTEIFMVKRSGEDSWMAFEPFCFVKPIQYLEETEDFSLSLEEDSHKGQIRNVGILAYPNKDLIAQGASIGSKVVFSDYSEYEFYIDGDLHYKMSTKDILMVLE